MSLDIDKVAIKTSLSSFLGSNCTEMDGATDFFEELAEKAEEVNLGINEYIFREKDDSDYVYIPVSGAVMLERATLTGSRQVFAFLFTGNILGISEHKNYSFSAKTLTNAVVIKINQQLILDIFDKYPAIAQRYHEVTRHILTLILDQLFIMGQKTAHQRLAHFLLDMKYRLGHGTQTFHLPMSRQDIADYLGMSLETASRGFSKLKKDGLISIENNYQITLENYDALKAYAED
ncbi:helix-turn-helix domain-containing protein [Thalassotalea sp. M1531]|uniref:Helix-turn-helix domain-containing protein n=1 Tax=Thalassotalea algicola TaxID=2716224 RepID=A0A7Y0L939_9GAMM|nr:helix-turn-helix domain-containing protein [Thalassotalea algicola]NMP30101.1 helix-turn-helix domain-containing protein [Thalassotalea algicola]